MTTPKRIQRKRTKGWKMPPNTVYVGRPTKWGNPYERGDTCITDPLPYPLHTLRTESTTVLQVHVCQTKRQAVQWYRKWIKAAIAPAAESPLNLEELRGKNLACWCNEGEFCHADVLLELANKPQGVPQ